MLKPLYLDTARLGQMSPKACRASIDFSRFAAEHGCDLHLSQLLMHGFDRWPKWLRDSYSGLCDWQGVSGLKNRLRTLSQSNEDSKVALASRSSSLMRLAAKLISGPCRNVLVTDLTWPVYGEILEQERKSASFRMTVCPVRANLLRDEMTSAELIQKLVDTYISNECDGLFLPLIDNFGVKLPVQRIVESIESQAKLRFVLVDGAQALGQIPLELERGYCDFLVAGCHKWLRAYSPMGVGFYGMRGGGHYIDDSLQRWLKAGTVDDPLMTFIQELETGQLQPFGETVHIAPLFNANAAAEDALQPLPRKQHTVHSAISFTEVFHGWHRVGPKGDMQSDATLFENHDPRFRAAPAETIRRRFFHSGVVVTAYDKGLIRVSEPRAELNQDEADRLIFGFNGVPLEFQ